MSEFKDFLNITSAIAPVWYKDSLLFYLHNKTGTYQLYAYNVTNKTTRQYTNYQDNIISYNISDSLDLLIFTKASQGNEQAQIYTMSIITRKRLRLTKDLSVRHNLGNLSNSQEYITYSSNERNGKDMDIYIMSLKTRENRMVRNSSGIAYASSFSPDDNYVTILQNTTNVTNEIFIYDLVNNKELQLTDNNNSLSVRCTWLDNEHIITNSNIDSNYFRLITYNIKTRVYQELLQEDAENDIVGYKLSPQKDKLFTLSNKGGYMVPRLFKLCDGETTLITSDHKAGSYRGASYSCSGKALAYSYNNDTSTSNIFLYDLETNEYNKISNAVQKVLQNLLSKSNLKHYKSFDGLTIPYFIYLPDKQKKDIKNAPILINIHGGPEAQYTPGFNPIVQYFTSIGFIVVCPNVRGSSGYGKEYLALDNKERRMDSIEDIKCLTDEIRGDGYNGKMVLHGASYGGFAVYAALAKYPGLWSAGVSIVGIANFITFLQNTAPYRRKLRESEYGSLQDDRELLERISPINMVQDIKAPTLIIHGKNDSRVPLSEAKQMYILLKSQDTYTELIIYDDEGHGLSRTSNRIDAYSKIVAFLKKNL